MRKVMIIQHVECEPLGSFSLASERSSSSAQNHGEQEVASFEYIRPYEGDPVPASLAGRDALIILGGPMAVYDAKNTPHLEEEIALIGKAIAGDVPTLGICLGTQLIAAAAGARVHAGPVKEIGWSSVELTEEATADQLFSGFPSTLPVFQLHGDTFELPPGAVRLAYGPVYENQAFRIGRHVYGLQFHMEVTEELARLWVKEYADYLADAGVDASAIIEKSPKYLEAMAASAHRLIDRFLKLESSDQDQ